MNRNRSLLIGESPPAETIERIRLAADRASPMCHILSVAATLTDTRHLACTIRIRLDEEWFDEEWDELRSRQGNRVYPASWTIHAIAESLECVKTEIIRDVPEATDISIEIA